MLQLIQGKLSKKYWVQKNEGKRITPKFKLTSMKEIDCFMQLETSVGRIIYNKYGDKIIYIESEYDMVGEIKKVTEELYVLILTTEWLTIEKIYDSHGNESKIVKLLQPSQDLRAFKQELAWGFMDLSGNIVIPPEYGAVTPFNEYGYAIVSSKDLKQQAIIDKKGNMVVNWGSYTTMNFISKEHLKVSKVVKEGCKWGIIDIKEKVIVPCTYDDVMQTNVYFKVKLNNKYGLFNMFGFPTLECIYPEIIELPDKFVVQDFPKKEVPKFST